MPHIPKISAAVVVSILATGLLLKFAADGNLGAQAQTLAKYVTSGYGSV